jgi:ATP-dependent Lon protease
MNQEPMARDALDDKINRIFAGKVVRKDLVRKVKVGANVPVFVLEYLLGKYCASSDEMAIQMGLQVVNDTLADNYIRPDESTKAQSKVKQKARIQKPLPTHAAGHPGFGLVMNSSGRWCWQRKN